MMLIHHVDYGLEKKGSHKTLPCRIPTVMFCHIEVFLFKLTAVMFCHNEVCLKKGVRWSNFLMISESYFLTHNIPV